MSGGLSRSCSAGSVLVRSKFVRQVILAKRDLLLLSAMGQEMRAQGRRDLALQIPSSGQTFSQMLFYRVSSVHPNCLCVSLHFSFSLDFVCRENIVAIHFFPEARSQRTLKLEDGIKALFCFSVLFFREYAARPGDVLLVFRVISPCNIL